VDVEVAELVGGLVGGDHVEVIAELLLLQVLLGEVLEVSLGEGGFSSDEKLGAVAGDGYCLAEHAGLAVDLDAVVKELLEGSGVKNLVIDGGGAVDGELEHLLLLARAGGCLTMR